MCCETIDSKSKLLSYMNDNRNDNGMQSINYNWISRYEISVIVIHWYIYSFIYRDRCLDKKPRRPEYNSLTPNAYPLYLITLHIKWNRTNSIFIHNINQWLIKKKFVFINVTRLVVLLWRFSFKLWQVGIVYNCQCCRFVYSR